MAAAEKSSRADALAVVRTLRDAGHVAYFAGGCVRDELLGLTPSDYDVATDAPPQRIAGLFRRTQMVGAAFGVVLVRQGKSAVETATFRTDGAYADGRRPDAVRFATAAEDARRRDFTINGLFLDPLDGSVIDHVGGRADLAARRLRAIGAADERFAEDHLRLLRAVRFAARFGLEVEPQTDAALRRHAGRLARISPERVAEELRRMLTPPTRVAAVDLLRRHGLLDVILRTLPDPPDSPDPAGAGGAVFDAMGSTQTIDFPTALAALAVDRLASDEASARAAVAPESVRRIVGGLRRGLKVSNDEAEAVAGALNGLAVLLDPAGEPREAALKRLLATPAAPAARRLLDALAAGGQFGDRADALRPRLAVYEQTDVAPPPLVTGDDLIAVGLPPGPGFKPRLAAAYDAQLEGRVNTRESALAVALESALPLAASQRKKSR